MMLGRGANYDHSFVNSELAIYDLNSGDVSVTNDAENVVTKLAATYPEQWPPKLVIYRDSTGTWDGIKLNERGQFAGFYALQEIALSHALEEARKYLAK